MIIKLIDHVQVAEKFIGKELHVVVVARALGELLLVSHLLVGVAITATQRRNSQRLHGRLELTVSRQQIVVLRLELERKIGRGWMGPQGTYGILHLVVVVVIVVHRTAQIVIV